MSDTTFWRPSGNWKSVYAGYSDWDGTLDLYGNAGFYWSSTQTSANGTYRLAIYDVVNTVDTKSGKAGGFSIRCLKTP